MDNEYDSLMERMHEVGQLESVEAVLDWDQETYMPPKGVSARAEQLSLLARMIHDRKIDPEVGVLLEKLDGEADEPVRCTNIREVKRAYNRATRVPSELVGRIARVSAHAKSAWAKAKKKSDFAAFAPHLKELVELKREVADRIGYEGERYDALMDEFEPGAVSKDVARVFEELQGPLSELVQRLAASADQPDASILHRNFPQASQAAFARKLAGAIGFDFERGRIDTSTHPFCSGTTPHDVRLTTRYDENFFSGAIFSTLHEAGHGLYEQGLDPTHMFTPMGVAVSLGIHESQSRMWENMIGRSRPFWAHFYGDCQAAFSESLGGVALDDFVRAINTVEPSFIRVEADEVTYNLHIILRFELERDIISGKLAVDDIPEAWNAKMVDLLGITPEHDGLGCLQDIHWSLGAFGYFPTYALGNLYAAQFFAKLREDLPDLDQRIATGDFGSVREWLIDRIHRHGKRYRAGELVQEVTGQPLTTGPFLSYVHDKFLPVYGLD